jgi:hypothetical protein
LLFCNGLNEQIILTADTVNRLSVLKSYESVVVPENVTSSMDVVDADNNHNNEVMQTTDEMENVPNANVEISKDDATVPITETHFEVDSKSADTVTLINEQMNDPTLAKYFDMVQRGKQTILCS